MADGYDTFSIFMAEVTPRIEFLPPKEMYKDTS